MVVTNKNNIEKVGIFLMFSLPVILIAIFCHLMIFKKVDVIIIIFFLLMTVIMTLIYRLNYKEFENSGFVITVRKRHLIFGKCFVSPILEFPLNLLKQFQIRDNILFLHVESTDRKPDKIHKFRVAIDGFSHSQFDDLITLLTEGNHHAINQ